MSNQKKLLIFTSRNGDEYGNYWQLASGIQEKINDHLIIINGQNIDINNRPNIEQFINDNNFVILIHKQNEYRFETYKFQRNTETIEYPVYYYSSTYNDICSINSNDYSYCGTTPPSSIKTLDVLRCAIINDEDISKPIEDLISSIEKNKNVINRLETVLEFLHKCLIDVPQLPDEIDNSFKQTINVVKEHDCSISELYEIWKKSCKTEDLSVLRDAVLEWAEK